jgi:hypothetical protein
MFAEAENGWPPIRRIASNSLKDGEAVLHGSADKRDNAFAGGPQFVPDPYITSVAHIFFYPVSLPSA